MASFKEFYDLLSIPNDAHHPKTLKKCTVEAAFAKRGFSTAINYSFCSFTLQSVMLKPTKIRTVLIYLQIDGQPVILRLGTRKIRGSQPWKKKTHKATGTIAYERLYEAMIPIGGYSLGQLDAKGGCCLPCFIEHWLNWSRSPTTTWKWLWTLRKSWDHPNFPKQ